MKRSYIDSMYEPRKLRVRKKRAGRLRRQCRTEIRRFGGRHDWATRAIKPRSPWERMREIVMTEFLRPAFHDALFPHLEYAPE